MKLKLFGVIRGNTGIQPNPEHFRLLTCMAENVPRFCFFGSPFSGHLTRTVMPWLQSMVLGQLLLR